nr:phage holin family protein [Candidatus Thermoplasmatota archaeon]
EQAQSPEMQQLAHGARVAGNAVGGAASTVAGKASDATHSAADAVRSTTDSVRSTVHHAQQNVHDAVESAKHTVHRAKEEVKVRAEAVAETGRRARSAPRNISYELREAFAVWRRALVTSIAMMLTLVIFSAIALIVLTIALVVGLNAVLGDPAGTFVVALAYVVIAGIAWAVARSSKMKAAREREERMENVREEVRHVVRPVKDAFGGRGRAGI